jgi:hypothetical protein
VCIASVPLLIPISGMPMAVFFQKNGIKLSAKKPVKPAISSVSNHGKSNLPHLRQNYFNLITREVIPEMFEYLIQSIIAKKSDIRIFLHGYGYPIPDGRAVALAGFEFAGPWFEPALTRKNLTQADGQVIVTKLIDALNEGIAQLAAKYPKNVHHIDLRKIIQDSDWENELFIC